MQMNYYIVSFSGGKDSTAMLFRLLELNEPINEVIWCDTYKEFPQMYTHIEKVKKLVEAKDIKFTTLKSEKSFDYYMFEYQPKRKNPELLGLSGFSWAGSRARWCTGRLKVDVINKYIRKLEKEFNVIQYIGLAFDEPERVARASNQNPSHRHPLVDWGWDEAKCLEYCYSIGFDWDGLYTHFDRVSCWCCPLQSLEDLRQLRTHYPALWDELKEMDGRTWRRFRADYSVEELEKRFIFEEARLAEGKSIRSREFFSELKLLLRGNDNGIDNT